jgi:putative FmdB family regulatory protein
MPLYDYECRNCGKVNDVIAPVAADTLACKCGASMKRLFSFRVNINPDYEPYYDENISKTGEWVKSRQHRRELMKENGLVEVG